ncbi:hypothetical protein HPB47_022567 [Ixodes persulcatus]|uniref:Uncharacterized protein n=1 Tax=Ixodes persulcatus TaxID=34615 RepID=A0AC60Q9T4_IXOPE|nr:hypothetical protein HPB47_022567 [Ixodes persulcatus]
MVTRIVELENQLRRERDERQALEERLKNVEGSRTETVALNGNGGETEKRDDKVRSVTSVGDGDGDDDGSDRIIYSSGVRSNTSLCKRRGELRNLARETYEFIALIMRCE